MLSSISRAISRAELLFPPGLHPEKARCILPEPGLLAAPLRPPELALSMGGIADARRDDSREVRRSLLIQGTTRRKPAMLDVSVASTGELRRPLHWELSPSSGVAAIDERRICARQEVLLSAEFLPSAASTPDAGT